MKKRSIKLEINLTNKWLYTFIFLGAVLLLTIGVFAYNSGKSASVFGHSAGELTGVCLTNGTGCPTFSGGIDSCEIVVGEIEESKEIVCCPEGKKAFSYNSPENDYKSFFTNKQGLNPIRSGVAPCVSFSELGHGDILQVLCC